MNSYQASQFHIRATQTLHEFIKGTGLRLAMMNYAVINGIVQNHGGEIIAESGKEHGSTFRIRLPMGEGNG